MSRRDELISIIPEDSLELVSSVIDDVVFLEGRLEELKKLPFIQVHPQDATKQRSTPASKLYKEFLQQYINCIKMIEGVIYRDKRLEGDEAEESPLRKWFKEYEKANH
jgi:hypothetical protein